jgi:hypothetical protein
MNAHRDCSSISLFSLNPLDVDHKFLTITLNHFANLLSLVVTTNNLFKYSHIGIPLCLGQQFLLYLDFIIFTDGDVSDVIFLLELFGKRSRHQNTSFMGRCAEVTLAILPPGRAYAWVELHVGFEFSAESGQPKAQKKTK